MIAEAVADGAFDDHMAQLSAHLAASPPLAFAATKCAISAVTLLLLPAALAERWSGEGDPADPALGLPAHEARHQRDAHRPTSGATDNIAWSAASR